MDPFLLGITGVSMLCVAVFCPSSRWIRFFVFLPALIATIAAFYKVGGEVGRASERGKYRYVRSLLYELDRLNASDLKHEIHQLNISSDGSSIDLEEIEEVYHRLSKK
jgi:hypothetical protein